MRSERERNEEDHPAEFECWEDTSEMILPACRWFQAVLLAEATALMYQPPKSYDDVLGRVQAALKQLESSEDTFDAVRATFLKRFGTRIIKNLDASGWPRKSRSTLHPAPVSTIVKERFLSTLTSAASAKLLATFHGTNPSNFCSIFSQGLLVPNPVENGIRV
eukprot:5527620-Amphidinium_carterae.1